MASVLIVDDEVDITDSLTSFFEMEAFSVQALHDGRSAWDTIQKEQYDLIVLDVMMPGMSGLEVLSRIRDHSDLSSQPVLMMSAGNPKLSTDEHTRFLKKPFELDHFFTTVQSLVNPPSN